ncbi:cupin domain-containing protein [Niveispirillum sp.]|uniref:cupin domain-containing protein n=1 Tax=Niveispirillum sp. TaxID=1917217 RepID=UPI001B67F4D3|nr:cupin domain-containing protein [Niveispirillum sp.]MBP7339388.1 cupin domain-containing protein [Niveispirillum sp.]
MTSIPDAAALSARLVRYADLRPCTTAFIDARTPGSNRKENFTIIGPGVAENPDQHVHISEPHGFNIGGARQPPHCVNSQHSHETAEVFAVFSGTWAFTMGVDKKDSSIIMGPGDVISIPTNCFRGFENVGSDTGFLFAVLGGDDPGRVTWAPDVIERARGHGLVLLENGALVDTAAGGVVPADAQPVKPLPVAALSAFDRIDAAALARCVVRAGQTVPQVPGAGLLEEALIGPDAPLSGSHGFILRRLTLAPGTATAAHARREVEVLFVLSGAALFRWDGGELALGPGDTFSVPKGLVHSLHQQGGDACILLAVRGGDDPVAAIQA